MLIKQIISYHLELNKNTNDFVIEILFGEIRLSYFKP